MVERGGSGSGFELLEQIWVVLELKDRTSKGRVVSEVWMIRFGLTLTSLDIIIK